MYQEEQSGNKDSLAIVSSAVLFQDGIPNVKRRKVNLQCLPGAWIDNNNSNMDDEEEEEEEKEDGEEKKDEEDEEGKSFIKTVSPIPPKLSLLLLESTKSSNDGDIELLKQTIANLRKEKEKLEETNDIVKKSIQIVAKKRLIAQTNQQQKKIKNSEQDDDEEDIYIVVPSDFIPPTQDEMKAAGLDGWEWITAY